MDRYLGCRPAARPPCDEDTAASYAVATRAAFEALVGTATQVSAALLSATVGLGDRSPEEALLCSASALHIQAVDGIRSTRVPASASHFHHHLERAASLMGASVAAMSQRGVTGGVDVDNVLAQMRGGWRELNKAAAALPGLSVLNLGHCCALAHGSGWLIQS